MSLKRFNGQWNTFEDDREDFRDKSHNYINDLDIFGRNSLFQWINTCNTYIRRQKLRQLLSGVVGNTDDIRERQIAIGELAGLLDWRQRFQVEGMLA
ncbi:MAG TPA: hypothetical protein GXX53_01565 [Tissierellia bacterium]|nr:hypothetical protein [Tissierellia bacterium]